MSSHQIPLSRRAFVAGVAASFGAPLIIPRSVLGGHNHVPANDQIALACVGNGTMMYSSHLPHFVKMPEVRVVAVSDVDATRCEAGKKRVDDAYGNEDCVAEVDYRELLARDDIDAIVCATPDHWHAMIILDACRAGKDIYCEKPLTNNLVEAKAVLDAVQSSSIVFQTGSQQRADREFRYACELVRNGRIGAVQRITVGVGGPPQPCNLPEEEMEPGLDWDLWLGPAPLRPYSSVLSPRGMHSHFPSWRNFLEYGGGGMTDWGAHHFDIAQWGLDMDQSGPLKIVLPENPKRGRDVTFVYEHGVEVVHGGPGGVTFIGTDGEIHVDRGKLSSKPGEIIEVPIGENEIHLYQAPGGGHGGHRQDWVNCLRSREQPNCPIEVGARTVAVCHLGNIAYLYGEELGVTELEWDPAKWEFVGNEAANRYRDYPFPRREGYELATG